MVCRSSTPISADRATTTEENAMLTHPMLDQLGQLGLSGMAQAFAELEASDETAALTHADWLGLLLDRELTHRRDKRLAPRRRYPRPPQPASVEAVDSRAPTRPRPRSVPEAHQWRMDRRARQPDPVRAHRG